MTGNYIAEAAANLGASPLIATTPVATGSAAKCCN